MYNEHKKEASAKQQEALNLEAENQAVKKCSNVQSFQNGKDLTKISAENEMNAVVTAGGVENKAFVVEDSDRL